MASVAVAGLAILLLALAPWGSDRMDLQKTVNEAFRELIKSGECNDERIFGCPQSPFVPDGNIGHAPDWSEAVKKGENHWVMVAGLVDHDSSAFPLIFENPVDTSLPPRWNADAAGQKKPGRCWRDGKVVVGFVDGTVMVMPLEAKEGTRVALQPHFGNSHADDPLSLQMQKTYGVVLKLLPVEQ